MSMEPWENLGIRPYRLGLCPGYSFLTDFLAPSLSYLYTQGNECKIPFHYLALKYVVPTHRTCNNMNQRTLT